MRKHTYGYLYAILTSFLYSLVAVVVKTLITGGTHPVQVTFYQYLFTIAIVGSWIFIRNRNAFRVDPKMLCAFALLGIVGGAFTNLCFYTALQYLDAGITSMLLFLHPVCITLFFAVTRIKAIKPFNYFSVLLAALGVAIVLDIFSDDLSFSAVGLVFGILSAVTYAFYNIFADLKLKAQDPNVINFYACAAAMVFTMTLLIGGGIGFRVEPVALPAILFLATFSGVLPVYCFFKALQYIGSEKVSVIACSELPLTLILAFTVLKEQMKPFQLIGVALIVLATFLLHRNEKPEEAASIGVIKIKSEEQKKLWEEKLDFCKKNTVPREKKVSGAELKNYLIERHGAVEMEFPERLKQMYRKNVSADLGISDGAGDLLFSYLKIPDKGVRIYMELTNARMQMSSTWYNTDEMFSDIVLWTGITQEDIDQETPVFMIYADEFYKKERGEA